MKRLFVNILLLLTLCAPIGYAQNQNKTMDSDAIVTNSFWDNWFGQIGVDMWLQNPYGSNFNKVFPNGKTFGVDLAIGKWITPLFGIRGIFNWENSIIKNHHASWVHKGSKCYLVFAGDFLVNLTNLFGDYKPDKKWNLSVFPRAGALIDVREYAPVGSPILGFGVDCNYRLNNKWSLLGMQ